MNRSVCRYISCALLLSLALSLCLLFVGIVHTGVAYALYFGAVSDMKAQTAALFSYLDPVVAILLSALLLGEPMTLWVGIGAVLVLGAALLCEMEPATRQVASGRDEEQIEG